MANPLGVDPSRTLSLRRAYIRDIRRRFANLAKSVRKYIDGDDSLGLKGIVVVRSLLTNADSKTEALRQFQQWFQEESEKEVLGDKDTPWVQKYTTQAYKKGATRGYEQVNRKKAVLQDPAIFSSNKTQWLRMGFEDKDIVDKLDILAERSFSKIKSYLGELNSEAVRILSQSLSADDSPEKIANLMLVAIDKVKREKIERLANTEVMYAHGDGQLDSFERLGIKNVGLEVELRTAEDNKVCPECALKSRNRYSIREARGILPIHPHCRCIWVPVL